MQEVQKKKLTASVVKVMQANNLKERNFSLTLLSTVQTTFLFRSAVHKKCLNANAM